jgi:hypothetical protein
MTDRVELRVQIDRLGHERSEARLERAVAVACAAVA